MKSFDLTSNGSWPLYLDVLWEILGDTSGMNLIDLGCGECAVTQQLPWKTVTLIDVDDMPNRPQGLGIFHHIGVLDANPVFEKCYDVAYAGDVIEHLVKADGLKLIERMTKLAKASVIFTPLGAMSVDPSATSPHAHKSGWMPEEFEALGMSTLAFPLWHPTLNAGAIFAWKA